MKALEILKENKRAMNIFMSSFDVDCIEDEEYISAEKYIKELNEAIKELEAINSEFQIAKEKAFHDGVLNGNKSMEVKYSNRTCENCKYFTTYKGEYGTCKIGVNNRKIDYLHNSFYCNIWESK